MLKRLELQALQADLQTVSSLLGARTEEEDPIGFLQFSYRRDELTRQIEDLADLHVSTANVGLFFGGQPVLGSRGIDATFGSKAIEQFQMLVSTKYGATNGAVGSRGRLPRRDQSELLVTDVVRGSFGFVMEENGDADLVDSGLKHAVAEVVDLIYRLGAPDEEAFEAGLESLDNRLLTALKNFFHTLDDAGATIRLVEDTRDFSLMRDSVTRARERTDGLAITEDRNVQIQGRLYLLPDAHRFELHPSNGDPTVRGTFTELSLEGVADADGRIPPGVIGETWLVDLAVRTVRVPNRDDRHTYRIARMRRAGI
ncbi:hypothetical protein [Antarcticirhabdus aurantiaca]|uniref:hypothetical protein n=1 Tax=Antarcticirhabdus aurantiaca TaxID=2606717 RepID=UPI001AEE0E78|nr:hypothetical protein [Antarcticirhabdus aurantiaca]